MKAVKVFFQIICLATLVIALGFTNSQYKNKICQDFRISFSEQSRSLISAGEIILLMETVVDSIVGMPIKDLPINQLERRIEQQTNIKNAEVFLSLDHCLHIDIQQKTPIARIKFAYQNEYYMDENGKMFDLSSNHTERILVVNGHITDSMDLHHIYRLASFINTNTFWKSQIVQIFFKKNKEIELIPRVGNHTILMGSVNGFEEKFKKLQLFYQQGVPQVGWNTYKEINLKFKDQIVCVKK